MDIRRLSGRRSPKSGYVWLLIVPFLCSLGCGSPGSSSSSTSSSTGTPSTGGNSAQVPPGLPQDRTTFVRTDDTPLSVVYDPVHNLVFASALHLNCVDVISPVTAQVIKSIPVSGPLGLSLSTDGTEVLVGTQVGVIAWIDIASLQIVKRETVPQLPPGLVLQGLTYLSPAQAYQLANGKILLFSKWGLADLYGNVQSSNTYEWDPTSNSSELEPNAGGGGLVSMSADHQKMLIAGRGAPTLYDSATDSFKTVPGLSGASGVFFKPAMSPSGSQFVLLGGSPLITFFNAQMQVIGGLNLPIPRSSSPVGLRGAVYSPDGKYLYVVMAADLPMIFTVDTTTFQVVGTSPAYSSEIAYFSEPAIAGFAQAADSTGLVFELADHGVAINGAPAAIATKALLPAQLPYPFPADYIVAGVPPGSPGPQDIVVTSPSGSATYHHGFHYVTNIVDYPSPDATMLYLLYDWHRNAIYISARDHIDVFSLSTNSFSTPISVPSNSTNRLILGLALTPDGSRLLAANQSDQSVALINPDNPGSGAVAISFSSVLSGMPGLPGPFQIATTSTGHAFVTTTVGNVLSGGGDVLYDINLSSLTVTKVTPPTGLDLSINNSYIQGSSDGSVVVEASSNDSAGPLLSWQASTGTWQNHLVEGQFWFDGAISGDGNIAVAGSTQISGFPFPYLFDPQLNLTAQVNSPEFQSAEEGPSLALDQSGALLFAVNPFGVDVIDARTGQVRERLLLSEQILLGATAQLQTPSKTLAITPSGQQIFLLTTAGLTVVTLDSVPLGIGSITPSVGAAGTLVTVRGTGIVPGTSVTVNGIPAVASYVDSSTVKVTVPANVHTGANQFVLTNPDGSSFLLDVAFLVQ
jgi:hypothetical protein